MQAEQCFIPKTFELANELTGKIHTFNIQVLYVTNTREINMSRAISSICSLGLPLNNCQIFYQDFTRKVYAFLGNFPFKQEVYLKYELFLDSAIKIRFKSVSPDNTSATCGKGAAGKRVEADPLKKKVKERTIREASDYVGQWRNLYQVVDSQGKRVYTLETAANKVGLAKKTLDDYYYQLRQAEYYGFNFQAHKHDKIGVLRRFVKQCLKNEQQNSLAMAPQDEIDRYLASSSDSEEERRYK